MASVTNESVGIIDEMIRTWEDYQKIAQVPLCVRKCHTHWLIVRRRAKTVLQVPEVSMTTLNWESPSY